MTTSKTNDIHVNTAAIRDRLGTYPTQFQTHLERQFYRKGSDMRCLQY